MWEYPRFRAGLTSLERLDRVHARRRDREGSVMYESYQLISSTRIQPLLRVDGISLVT